MTPPAAFLLVGAVAGTTEAGRAADVANLRSYYTTPGWKAATGARGCLIRSGSGGWGGGWWYSYLFLYIFNWVFEVWIGSD